MPLFVAIGRDGPDGAARRPAARPAHLAHWAPLARAGRVRFAGPLRDEGGVPRGSVLVFEAPDRVAAQAHAAADPYVTGAVFEAFELYETLDVLPELAKP
jgi:uncharacterized protein YciI